MAAASDLFATKFFPTSADSKNKEFTVEDVDGATLKKVIDCCYTGQIALDEKIACEVIILANNLCFSYIENKCAEYLMSTISRENCGRLLTIADRTNVQNFVTKSIEFISKEFAHIESDQLLEINSFSLFSAILESDKIEAPEEIVFNRFKQWLDDKKNERSKLVCPLMINIQLYRISGQVSVNLYVLFRFESQLTLILLQQFLLDEVEPFCDEYGCEWLLKRECNRRIADAPITMPAQRFSHTVTPRNKSIFDI